MSQAIFAYHLGMDAEQYALSVLQQSCSHTSSSVK